MGQDIPFFPAVAVPWAARPRQGTTSQPRHGRACARPHGCARCTRVCMRGPLPPCVTPACWGSGTQGSCLSGTGVPSRTPQPIVVPPCQRVRLSVPPRAPHVNPCLLAPSPSTHPQTHTHTHTQPLGVIQALPGVWISVTTYQQGREREFKPVSPSASHPPPQSPHQPLGAALAQRRCGHLSGKHRRVACVV